MTDRCPSYVPGTWATGERCEKPRGHEATDPWHESATARWKGSVLERKERAP